MRKNDFYNTHAFLTMCKQFVDTTLVDNVDKTEQIKFKQDVFDFVSTNDMFDKDVFEQSVLKNTEIKQAFNDFKKEFEDANEVEFECDFDISEAAVKKGKNMLNKSVVKLDKNFHIYVHSQPNMMVRCYDDEKK